jgi:aldehyde dehydrogenase (NAD+)
MTVHANALPNVADDARAVLQRLGIAEQLWSHGDLTSVSPIDGSAIGSVKIASAGDTQAAIERAHCAFLQWRNLPPPKRGELVRLFADECRAARDDLARLVTLEMGKVLGEGVGEVQEMIDICDYAVGLSRQLYGLTIATERLGHRMMEIWHPVGVVGVISAFNFPVAVWAWNAAIAWVCGDAVVWKPSEKTPLTALAVQMLFARACAKFGDVPQGLLEVVQGGAGIGAVLVDSSRVPVLSATGSTRMGKIVGPRVASRFGRAILELGGNNAAIIAPSADLDLTLRAVAFAAMGTAGQRCTTLRRLLVHKSLSESFIARLAKAFASVKAHDPRLSDTLLGPLIDEDAFHGCERALKAAAATGGTVHNSGRVMTDRFPKAFYVKPAVVEMPTQSGPMLEETFAPILYTLSYDDLDEAIALQNAVTQGLSSSIFTTDLREAEHFMSAAGSDCGIANVNIGPSGAEIGGAFGGEKESGGGREAGSDAWKGYMRRATNTINYSRTLQLAQGVTFDVEG